MGNGGDTTHKRGGTAFVPMGAVDRRARHEGTQIGFITVTRCTIRDVSELVSKLNVLGHNWKLGHIK